MGPKILDITVLGDSSKLRVEAACARTNDGAVVLAFSNPQPSGLTLSLPGAPTLPRREWHLTTAAPAGVSELSRRLLSSEMLLNGELLSQDSLGPGGMAGRAVTAPSPAAIGLGAWSYGFVLLEAAGAAACRGRTSPAAAKSDDETAAPCDGQTCSSHGTCKPHGVSSTCTCNQGWSGTACDHPTGCDHKPCQNGGTCTPNGGAHTCACVDGYTGTECAGRVSCGPAPSPPKSSGCGGDEMLFGDKCTATCDHCYDGETKSLEFTCQADGEYNHEASDLQCQRTTHRANLHPLSLTSRRRVRQGCRASCPPLRPTQAGMRGKRRGSRCFATRPPQQRAPKATTRLGQQIRSPARITRIGQRPTVRCFDQHASVSI